jgi:hypothetical protein
MTSQDFWVNLDPDLDCSDPTLLAVHRYWDEKRGRRHMPSRNDIDPLDLGRHLGSIILIDVEHAPFRLRYRLIGTTATETMQRDSTGKYYDEIYSPELLEKIYASFHWMITHKAPLRTHGEAFYPDRNFYDYEALNLPLLNDDEVINMVLGVLVFNLKPPSD